MTTLNFDAAIAVVLDLEGIGSNDPDDPGGLTKYGISRVHHPEVDFDKLTIEMAKDIYRREYWVPIRADELPFIFALPLFDRSMNQSRDAVVRYFQTALGVAADGMMGPKTIAQANGLRTDRERRDVLADFLSRCALRICERSRPKFQRGLFRRLFLIQDYALGNVIPSA